jgi:urea ABC transporter urea binding protein
MSNPRDEQIAASTPNTDDCPKAPDLDATVIGSQDTESSVLSSFRTEDTHWVGKSLGKYQVTHILGKGGMGIVLKAHDPVIGRDVAIKVLAEHLASDATALARFLVEAKTAGRLNHPNVAGIHDVGQEGEAQFLVMEFVAGGSLADRLEQQGALSLLEATRAMVDACKGIGAAHASGLIHRDVKPANFLKAADGTTKVADFGLAKVQSTQSQQMTQMGTVMGTPYFMSPEQCQGVSLDGRSDIYSLGATYYSLLTGKNPYQDSSSVPQVMYAHCHGAIPDPRTLDESIPAACSRIIAKAMAKSPADRYQTVKEMQADLEMVTAALSGQTLSALPSESGNYQRLPSASMSQDVVPKRHRSRFALIAGGATLILGLLAALLIWWRPWEQPSTAGSVEVPASPPLPAEPIKVGVLHSLSGTMAENEAPIVDAIMFAIEEINQAGGVQGRPLKAIVADGMSDPETFALEAKRLIEEEKVCTIFGCWSSASRKSVKPIVEDHDHLLVYPLQYEGLETSPNIIYMGAAPNQQILPAIDWAFTLLGKRRFFLLGSDYVFPRAANEIIKDELKRLGAEVVGEQYLALGESDMDDVVTAIAKARPDMILNTINGDSNIAFFRALRESGIKPGDCPTLSFSTDEEGLRNLSPKDIAGDYAAWTYFEAIDTAENKQFVSRFRDKYPQRIVTDPMESAYVAVLTWARAANDVKSLEPRRIRRAMLEQRFESPGGEVRFDPDTQHCYKTPRIGQIQSNGRMKIVWTAPESIPPEPFPKSRTATEWLAFLHDLYTGWGNRWSAP